MKSNRQNAHHHWSHSVDPMLFIINCRHKAREGGQIALVLGGRPEAGFHDGCILDNQRFRHGGFPLEHDQSQNVAENHQMEVHILQMLSLQHV